MNNTIAAIATPRGRAALAIIRLSGQDALTIIDRCFSKKLHNKTSHTAHVGYIKSPQGEKIDHVVVTLFKSPNSATGEDVVEISCHGGDFAPQMILQTLLENGAQMAEPGEFTRRAFLNGKLDLTQAEAVADLIHASSSTAHRVSLNHLQGKYAEKIKKVRDELLEVTALIELELDFSEEDVEFANREQLLHLLDDTIRLLSTLTQTFRIGALVRDGIRVVIAGKPNAGKSTLLNALVQKDRAIVSPIAGTTRDEIEAETEIQGYLFKFVDTAGLRETQDIIEAEGVKRAHHSIQTADIVLYVYDYSLGLDEEEQNFITQLKTQHPKLPYLLIANKTDLCENYQRSTEQEIPFSALSTHSEATDFKKLQTELLNRVAHQLSDTEASLMVTNQRHRKHLLNALKAAQNAKKGLVEGWISGDRLSLDLRIALNELGAITGEITNEDILGEIFGRFCIGK